MLKIELVKIKPLSFDFVQKEEMIWDKHIVLESPQICKIIAPSGSGKSTLISILSGLRSDYSGDILFDSSSARNSSPKFWSSIRANKISMVYQDLRLFKNQTVRQNIQISQDISGYDEPNQSVDFLAEKMGILDQLDKTVNKLSFGQMQRVAIIRSILRKFDWLILDEPFSHLDLNNAMVAWSMILEHATIRKAGIIVACLDPYEFISADKTYHL